jgi:hypothetical protein
MAVEPYSEKTKRMLLLKELSGNLDSESMRQLEDKLEISSYFFVYYMMPIDPILPKLVVSVIPHTNGKANQRSNAHMKGIDSIRRDVGFRTLAFSADGDNTYDEFLKPICDHILSARGTRMTFIELVHQMTTVEFPFVTDFLHFMKCLRNRITLHPLSLHISFHPILAEELTAMLPVGDCLKPKSKGGQLKDAIALRVFTLENFVTLLMHGKIQEALYFMPIVLWRVANQALNVTREARLKLFGIAYDVTKECAMFYDQCEVPHICAVLVNKPSFGEGKTFTKCQSPLW